jgi:hypothetical protein
MAGILVDAARPPDDCPFMRILVVICHYFGQRQDDQAAATFSSQLDPLARIAAVNASIVALHRHFGARRHGIDPTERLPEDRTPERKLDIVVLQVPSKGLLDAIGIDPSCYTVEYFDGPPLMLCFEAQRVLRERLGSYDHYAVIEDDMVIHDPLFLDKLAWFERSFGTERLLQPTRYEMAQSGTPAMVVADPILSTQDLAPFRRPDQEERLAADWHGREQTFVLAQNPHSSCYFLSDAQLRHWVGTPWFYDRDASWIGPIESAITLSIGRTFDLYKPGAPDPFFLSIEHYGTRYARATAPPGVTYGDTPLLEIAHAALGRANAGVGAGAAIGRGLGGGTGDLFTKSAVSFNTLVHERDAALFELVALKRSRSRLFANLVTALVRKGLRW